MHRSFILVLKDKMSAWTQSPTILSPSSINLMTQGIFFVTFVLISPTTTAVVENIFSPKYFEQEEGNRPFSN